MSEESTPTKVPNWRFQLIDGYGLHHKATDMSNPNVMSSGHDVLDRALRGDTEVCLEERIEALEEALKPFAEVADAYDADELDECRPYWVARGIAPFKIDQDLYHGRGGKTLITLGHVLRARVVLKGVPLVTPTPDLIVVKARELFDRLYIGGPTWDSLSDARREAYVKKVSELEAEGGPFSK